MTTAAPPARPLVVAHRGNSSVAPQNTLAAFEAAWRADADAIELDIQVSADGRAVVIHDDTVDATTDGVGRVAGMLAQEARRLDAGSWFAPAYAGQPVPLFEDVMTFLADHQGIDLLLELKGGWVADTVRRVVADIDAAGLADRVVVQSFSVPTVHVLREVAPQLRRGLLIDELSDRVLPLCHELEVSQCNPAWTLVLDHPDLLPELHRAGLRAMVWTLNSPQEWSAALAAGVDGVITDRPDRLVGWLSAR